MGLVQKGDVMSDLSYTVTIDKVEYTDEQLARYEYERTLHVLHEIKRLGADVRDGGRVLSHTDINWLEPERAAQICLDIRASLGEEGIAELFADVLADSDRRWKQYNEGYVTGDVHFAEIEIDVTGIGMAETMAVIGGAADQRAALATHPEHFFIVGDITMGQRGMETFGMFGEPTAIHGVGSSDPDAVPEAMPFAPDPDYPVRIYGSGLLLSDDTDIHVGAFHQFRPRENGFRMRSTFFCPRKAPRAIVDGHKLHFALEILNSVKTAHAAKQNA